MPRLFFLALALLPLLAAQVRAQAGDWVKVWSSPTEGTRARFNAADELVIYGGEQVMTFERASGQLLRAVKTKRRDVFELDGPQGLIRLAIDGKSLSLLEGERELASYKHGARLGGDLAIGPQGKRVALEGGDKEVLVLSLPKLRRLHTLRGHAGTINDLAWSHDGKLLASADQQGEIRVWDPAGGALSQSLKAKDVTFSRVGFTPGGELISSDFNRTLRFWDPSAGTCTKVVPALQKMQSMAISKDGSTIATGHWGSKVRIWDTASRTLLATLPLDTSAPSDLVISDDGSWLAVVPGPLAGSLTLWHKGPPPAAPNKAKAGEGWTGILPAKHAALCFGPEGDVLYGAGNRLMVHVGPSSRGLSGPLAGGEFCGLSPKGVVFASGGVMSKKLSVKLLPLGSEALEDLFEISTENRGLVSIALQPGGNLLAVDREVADDERALELYSLETKALVRTLRAPKDRTHGPIAFSPDGAQIALTVSDQVQLYSVKKGSLESSFEADANGLGFSHDGQTLFVFTRQGLSAFRQGKESWKVELPKQGHMSPPVFSAAHERAAVACRDGAVRVVDLARGKLIAAFPAMVEGGLDQVGLAFSPDGKRLAISSTRKELTQVVSIANPPPLDPKEFFLGTIQEARAKAKKEGKRLVVFLTQPLGDNDPLEKALAAPEVKDLSDSYVWLQRDMGSTFERSEEAKALKVPLEKPLVVVIDPKRKKPLGWIQDPKLVKKALLKARPKKKRKRKKRKKR